MATHPDPDTFTNQTGPRHLRDPRGDALPNMPMTTPTSSHAPFVPPAPVRKGEDDRSYGHLAGPSRTHTRSSEQQGRTSARTGAPGDRRESHEAIASVEVIPARAQSSDPLTDPETVKEVLVREHAMPDGIPAHVGESRIVPPTILALAILGICGVGMAMLFADGVSAALVSIVWLTLGCLVAWIAVWGAGLKRAREEREIIKDVSGKDAGAPDPDRRDDRVHLGRDHGPVRPA